MCKYRISPFANSEQYSLELQEFVPDEGYESFLQDLCAFLSEKFLDWHQGIELGIGHMTYRNYRLAIYWTDFPFALSFDCANEPMAQSLRGDVESYFLKRRAGPP